MARYIVGVDIGGSHVCAGIVDVDDGIVVPQSVVDRTVDSHMNADCVMKAWADVIETMIRGSGIIPEGIGLAFPGPFDYAKGICLIEGVEKFDHLFGLDITTTLSSYLHHVGTYDLRYVNDAAAFVLGEALGGAGQGAGRVMGITLGTGVGSGFVVDGKLIVDSVEVPANGWVYDLPFEGKLADEVFSTRGICGRYAQLTGREVSGVKDLVGLSEIDSLVSTVFNEYGRKLADFLFPIYQLFHGDVLVLGGNISRAFEWFRPAMEIRLTELGAKVNLKTSILYDRAAMVGAASLFQF